MGIKPVGDKLLVEVIAEEKGAIELLNQEKPQTGIVKAIGSQVTGIPVGSVITFARYAGTEIHEGDDMLLIVAKKDVLTYE